MSNARFGLRVRNGLVNQITQGNAVPTALLDVYPSYVGYSLRKLRTAYTGNAIRVRRSNDNAEQNIGFNGNGDLDTTALLSFVGGNNGFVTTWYDQSTNGLNFTQTTAANQPQIVSAGSILTDNGRPSLRFDGSNDFMQIASSAGLFNFIHNGSDATTFKVVRAGNSSTPGTVDYSLLSNGGAATADTGIWLAYRNGGGNNNSLGLFVSRGTAGAFVVNSVVNNIFTPNVQSLVYGKFDADNSTAANRFRGAINSAIDSGNNTLTNAPSTGNSTFNLEIGRFSFTVGADGYLLGAFQELVIYNSDQSANRTGIGNNINSYYAIPGY